MAQGQSMTVLDLENQVLILYKSSVGVLKKLRTNLMSSRSNLIHMENPKPFDPTTTTDPTPTRIELAQAGKQALDASVVFDYEKNWHLVRPHLPAAEPTLAKALERYFAYRADRCIECYLSSESWEVQYDPDRGPTGYDSSDRWLMYADQKVSEAIDRGEFKWDFPEDDESEDSAQKKMDEYAAFCERFYPKPDTYQWYQVTGADFWLAHWQTVLGRLIFPHLNWTTIFGQFHSIALGVDLKHGTGIIMDILNFKDMTVEKIVELVSEHPETNN